MDWNLIGTNAVGTAVIAAIISTFFSGIISLRVAANNRKATTIDVEKRIKADRAANDAKLAQDREKALTDRAWADYALRRDVYLDLAKSIAVLFESSGQSATITAVTEKKFFTETCRKIRVIGSDDVVTALNDLTDSIKSALPAAATRANYSKLMNAIRQDIRTLNEKPLIGTALDESAFPIES